MTAALAGCAGQPSLGSVTGGESKVFKEPECQVFGQTARDQDWIDGNIEAGIGAFGWKRPKPHDECEPLRSTGATAKPAAPKKKPGLVQRIKQHVGIWPPVMAPPPVPPKEPEPLALDAPAAPPDPLDELLGKP